MPTGGFSWADMTFSELQPPFRIVERGRGGKYNRIRMLGTYTLTPAPGDSTKVEYTLETIPGQLSDRLLEITSAADPGTAARRPKPMRRRCETILEENRGRGRARLDRSWLIGPDGTRSGNAGAAPPRVR